MVFYDTKQETHSESQIHWSACRTATQSGRNDNEAVVGASSETFAGWLHYRYAPVELPSAGKHNVSPRDTLLLL